jgi:hypothetical protein
MTVGETASRWHLPQGQRFVTAVVVWARLGAFLDSRAGVQVQDVP